MKHPSTQSETARFRLPMFSWPLAACLTVALAISITPGCEDKAFETEKIGETTERETTGPRPLLEQPRRAATTARDSEGALAMELPGVDETGHELFVPDPLRLPHTDDPSIDQLERAYSALDRGDHTTAIEAFRKAAFDTESYQAFFGLGRTASLAGDTDLALEALDMAARVDETTAEPLVMAARLSLAEGDIELGLNLIDRAIGREPKRADAHNVRGRLWMAEEQYHRAILSFERAIELDSKFVWAWNNMGYVHLLTGRYEQAVDALEKAVRLSPVTAYMHNNLGLAYEKSGRTLEALGAFEEALALRPTYVNAIVNIERVSEEATAIAEAKVEVEVDSEGPTVEDDGTLEYVPGG